MIVIDNTIEAEGLEIILKNVGKTSAKAGEARKSSGRAFEIGAKIGTSTISGNPKVTLHKNPVVLKLHPTGERKCFGRIA